MNAQNWDRFEKCFLTLHKILNIGGKYQMSSIRLKQSNVDRDENLELLKYFISNCLIQFGVLNFIKTIFRVFSISLEWRAMCSMFRIKSQRQKHLTQNWDQELIKSSKMDFSRAKNNFVKFCGQMLNWLADENLFISSLLHPELDFRHC